MDFKISKYEFGKLGYGHWKCCWILKRSKYDCRLGCWVLINQKMVLRKLTAYISETAKLDSERLGCWILINSKYDFGRLAFGVWICTKFDYESLGCWNWKLEYWTTWLVDFYNLRMRFLLLKFINLINFNTFTERLGCWHLRNWKF